MFNFDYYNPTLILFGSSRIADIDLHVPQNATVMITYGGKSAKQYGTLDEVITALGKRKIIEFGGIEPNPSYEMLSEAISLAKIQNIDFLIAIGGGSIIDATKFIAAGVNYQSNIWDIWSQGTPITSALPFGCVLTLPATGSEMNAASVISHHGFKHKIGYMDPHLYPKFSILDPRKSFTLPKKQIANGVVDAFIHIIEQYLTYPVYGKIQDRFAESLLITLIEEGPKALEEPDNYDVRSTIMWCATLALNGLIGRGVPQDWATHRIGHQITALYNLDHAETLAIILPALLHIQRKDKKLKLLQYAKRVWQINSDNEEQCINLVIDKTREFFERMGVSTLLRSYNIPESAIDDITHGLEKSDQLPLGEHKNIDAVTIRKILTLSY